MSKRLALFLSILSVGACATRPPAPLPPSVLVVLSSVERLQDAPNATGNYLREVAYPVRRLLDAGYAVDFASPNGGAALVLGNTAYGLPDDRPRDPVLAEFDRSRLRDGRLDTLAPAEVDAARYLTLIFGGIPFAMPFFVVVIGGFKAIEFLMRRARVAPGQSVLGALAMIGSRRSPPRCTAAAGCSRHPGMAASRSPRSRACRADRWLPGDVWRASCAAKTSPSSSTCSDGSACCRITSRTACARRAR